MSLIQITSKKEIALKTSQPAVNLKINSDADVQIWLVDPTYTQQQISSEAMPEQIVNYDIVKFNSDKIPNRVEYYKLHKQMKLSFVLSNEQKDVLNRSISLYGNDELGVSRILTKVFVKKLVRNPIPESKISVIVGR